ncbi:Mss4p nuclear export [Ophidiomyces ophidiicola]|nr:Mss4p nuclear export [Ophidiomyces ophidiicola]KAI1994402.1 Mss4p nuclear export [Ophidiomyces ophidiicola]KAI1994991.1 Mss4p nuclear export [Ophidiomyces ophidiicola]KAI1997847.1 Mss4p nuclear export [Ophidiomyces ophidiicola]
MGKRKQPKDADVDMDKDESSGDDMDLVNVEFEWFDPQPAVDFHGLKVLLRQLFDTDAQLFDLSALTDLILSQPLLGSTVKVDGNETDPYAFLTVLNLRQHKDVPVINSLIEYVQSKSCVQLSPIKELLSQPACQIGLVLTERLINIPPEVIPPMYTMLLEEIQWAVEEKEPYQLTHYLIISKTYEEVESQLDIEGSRPQKKKKKGSNGIPEVFYFHPEDEVLQKHALCYGTYEYTHQQAEGHSDSKRAFQELGIRPHGSMILIESQKFETAVNDVKEYVNSSS